MTRAVVVVALLATACGGAPPCKLVITPAAERAPAFLWKAQKPGGDVVWLFGTIHNAAGSSVRPEVLAALDGAPRFVSELGESEPDPDKLRDVIRLPTGKGLDQQLPADDWYDLRDALRGAVKEADLARARPWFAMSRLTSVVGRSPKPGMDAVLAERAGAKKIPIEALETWDEQLATLADAVTIEDLQQAIHARRTLKCEMDQIRATYEAGDQDAMTKILAAEKLNAARNRRWLPALIGYGTGGAFVAVGLGHLLGADSLVTLLQADGFTVERVQRAP